MPRFLPILIAGFLLFLVDLYVFQAILTVTQNLSANWQKVIYGVYWTWYFLTFAVLVMIFLNQGWRTSTFKRYLASILVIVFGSKLLVVVFLLAEDGVRLVRYLAQALTHDLPGHKVSLEAFPRKILLSQVALTAGAIPLLALIYGILHGGTAYQVKKVVLRFPNLPDGFQGFKLLQISDLHTGSFSSDEPLKKAVVLINKQEADLVCFTGDLVNNVASEVEPFVPLLGQIRGKLGVFSVLGNHDYGDYVRWETPSAQAANLVHLKSLQARMGWRLLMNEHVPISRNGDQIALLGIENWGAKARFPKYGKMHQAYAGTEHYPIKILLSHDPSHWDGEVTVKYPDIDLMLSGHTHGMQFGLNLFGLKWSPVQYVYKQWSGLYKKGRQHLYVNVGLGYLGYPGRVGFLPEITVFEFRKT
jgi:predicted MPP superfamily phosphohydrolase